MGEGGEGVTLEYTPTWVVAAVCTVIVAISLGAERLLHYLGRYLKNKKQKSLFEALQKVKEGFSPFNPFSVFFLLLFHDIVFEVRSMSPSLSRLHFLFFYISSG